jgi:hypothetical protein
MSPETARFERELRDDLALCERLLRELSPAPAAAEVERVLAEGLGRDGGAADGGQDGQ